MKIKLSCKNNCANFEKTEDELRQEKVITHCLHCGLKLSIENLDDIIVMDLKKQIKNHLHNYFNSIGIEGSLELIERQPESKIKEMYKDELRLKGLIK